MADDFQGWAEHVKRLHRALLALEPLGIGVGADALLGQEWFELLRNKLVPQLETEPVLVVSVVGGTNIGKSVLFNKLAGEVQSNN